MKLAHGMTALSMMLAGLALVMASRGQGAAPPATPVRDGEAIFKDKCIYCHDVRGWGTRALARRVPPGQELLTRRDALPADFVKIAVRRGIGSMPGFTPTDLSDAEVAAVADWLDRKK